MSSLPNAQQENLSLSEKLNLIHALISPSVVGKRHKTKKTNMPCLFSLVRMHFSNQKKRRSHDYFGIARLAEWAAVSEKTFKNFISIKNGPFHHFGSVREQAWISNEYFLADWVKELFYLFMDMQALRGMKKDYDAWSRRFKKRLLFLIKLADEGKSLAEIREIVCSKPGSVNRLRTKSNVKMPTEGALNCPLSHPEGELPFKHLNQSEPLADSISRDFLKVKKSLESECRLHGGDLYSLFNQYSLGQIRRGLYVREEYLQNGLEIRSPIKLMVHCIRKGWKKKQSLP